MLDMKLIMTLNINIPRDLDSISKTLNSVQASRNKIALSKRRKLKQDIEQYSEIVSKNFKT